MTDEEIEKALVSCGTVECNECHYKNRCVKLSKDALDYITRLKEELKKSREDYWLKHNDACNQYETAEQRRKYIGRLMQRHKVELKQVCNNTVIEFCKILLDSAIGVDWFEFLFETVQAIADDDFGIRVSRYDDKIIIEVDDE